MSYFHIDSEFSEYLDINGFTRLPDTLEGYGAAFSNGQKRLTLREWSIETDFAAGKLGWISENRLTISHWRQLTLLQMMLLLHVLGLIHISSFVKRMRKKKDAGFDTTRRLFQRNLDEIARLVVT